MGKPVKRRQIQHGLSGTRLYSIWHGVKLRTTNPNHQRYPKYGARGIRMAALFDNPAEIVAEIGHPPPGMTLDRINFNKGYVPGNIRWADWFTQNNNRRTSVKYDYNGREYTMSELSRELGIPYHCLNKRIKILGWTVEKAIAEPKEFRRKQRT